ncbi:ankyrin repeat domain-containing protein 66-like [Hippoglossus stenolepis]|uniref:ankyrin repeat domain-containing protein 66-like n=1 Tax=Hippoglossus stenolepis TaxID=195615 RepID=UPI001FAF8A5D|nr:ankyrin repeat domain-containing protein 66-like [Hippoglossus stenolepis]
MISTPGIGNAGRTPMATSLCTKPQSSSNLCTGTGNTVKPIPCIKMRLTGGRGDILRQNKCNPTRGTSLEPQDPSALGSSQRSHLAGVSTGHTETVRILIEHGARPSLRTDTVDSCSLCCRVGRLAALWLLHYFHAPIDKEDCWGDKPVRIAEIYGHQDCVRFLKKAEIECQAYRKMAAEKGISLDDTDEEWSESRQRK